MHLSSCYESKRDYIAGALPYNLKMLELLRVDADHPDFQQLVRKLDEELALRDGDDHAFYAQYNKMDMIRHVVLAYRDSEPVSCGAIKAYNANTVEVKRMYTEKERRGNGIAVEVLKELERWALELGYQTCILETGIKQPEAIRLYEKQGYTLIPNYGQYAEIHESKCFEKHLDLT